MDIPIWAWLGFLAGVLVLLTVDLVAHRRAHVIGLREAAWWSVGWVSIGLGFAGVVWAWLGAGPAAEYTAAYLLEKSLSVDNLFVFALIFGYFKVPRAYQHRVLFYGVLGALVLRFIFIAAGVALLSSLHFVIYLFGAFLIYTAVKMVKESEPDTDPGRNIAVRALRRLMPITDDYQGRRFVLRRAGKLIGTPLLVVLVAVETADLLFAVDSVPAVLSVTDTTFLVYASNALAILGLRSLYFLLSGMLERFHHLGRGLAVILGFVGAKMVLSDVIHIPIGISLGVIAVALTVAVVASLLTEPPAKDSDPAVGAVDGPADPLDDGPESAGNGTTPENSEAVTVGPPAR